MRRFRRLPRRGGFIRGRRIGRRGKALATSVLGRHFFQKMPRVAVDIQKTGGNAQQQETQFAPGARVQPAIQTVSYGKTHQRPADQVQTDDPGGGQGLHAALLLFENVLE